MARTGQTLGLEEVILHHTFKKMAGKTVRVPCRERTHLSGDNGAGKTSILSLIPVFYGEEPERLVSKAGSKSSFLEFYLSSPQSMIIFEYTQAEGFCCVVMYRHRSNKVCYRFIKGAADDTIFSESISEKLREGASAQEAIDLLKESDVRVSRQILTIQDYRAIIQRDPELIRRKGADSRVLRSEAMEFGLGGPETKMRFIHKLAHVVLNKNNLMGNFKTMICETMFQDVHLNTAPVSFDADNLISEINSLKAFSQETDRIRRCLVDDQKRLALRDEALQVKLDLIATMHIERDRLDAEHQELGRLKESIETLEAEFNKARSERYRLIEQARIRKESIDGQLNRLHEKDSEYREEDLPRKAAALKTLPGIKKQLAELRTLIEKVTEKVDQFRREYEAEVNRISKDHDRQLDSLRKQYSDKEREILTSESRMNNEITSLGKKQAEETMKYVNDRQARETELNSRKAVLESKIENAGYLAEEQAQIDEATTNVDQAFEDYQEADAALGESLKEEIKAKSDYDACLEKESGAKRILNSRIGERDELMARLNPEPGTWLSELREIDPEWGSTLGKIVRPELLMRKDLAPSFDPNLKQWRVIGWTLDFGSIELPEVAEGESKIKERIDRSNASVTMATRAHEDAKKATVKAASAHAEKSKAVDDARVKLSQKHNVLETRKGHLKNLKRELLKNVEIRKLECEEELKMVSGDLDKYRTDTADGKEEIKGRYLEDEMELKSSWQGTIQDLNDEKGKIEGRINTAIEDHDKTLEKMSELFVQACSEHGVDPDYVSRLHKDIEELVSKEEAIEQSKERVVEYDLWLRNEWSRLSDLNEQHSSAKAEHNKLKTDDHQKQKTFDDENQVRLNKRKALAKEVSELDKKISDAQTIVDRFSDESFGLEGRVSEIGSLTQTLSNQLAELAKLKKQVFQSFRSAQAVIQNYTGTQIHKTWEEIIEHRNAMLATPENMDAEEMAIRHVEALRSLIESNIPQLESAAREHFFNESGKLVAYFEGLQNLTRKVKSVASILDKNINTDQRIESLEDIRIVLTPKVQDDKSWGPLKDFSMTWKDWSSINHRHLPNDEIIRLFRLVQDTLKEAKLGTDIKTMVDVHIAMKEGGRDTVIRSEVDFEDSSSKGLSYLAIMVIFMGMTRFLCPDDKVRITWPVDELATLSNNNIPKLADMLERNNLTMMSACPDLSQALSRFFENKMGVLPGRVVQYTEDEAIKMSQERRNQLKSKLAFTEETSDVV